MQICLCLQVPFSIHESVIALPLPASLVNLFQDPFEIRGLVKDLAGKRRVGDDLSVAVVLQGAGTDVEPFTYFLACEEVFTAEERPVHLGHFLIRSLTRRKAETTACISPASILKS